MRLLNARTFALQEYFEGDEAIPPYAILSHRWGSEEISFADLHSSNQEQNQNEGFRKIRGFCLQAIEGGFEHVWVDTCCINKDSSAELSEAINSMFQWYADAAVCYAYLSDVTGDITTGEEEVVLSTSKWFTRGWTLQELIAPPEMVFYDANWVELGTRDTLKATIASITGIHDTALGASMEQISKQFSIAQRMSWAANRVTTRIEDIAYCLLGIFNVNMPLLYGEKEKAFIRLQEQIIDTSNDQTIFCWHDKTVTPKAGKIHSYNYYKNQPSSLLASSPLLFANCSSIAQTPELNTFEEFKMTKLGLNITGPVFSLKEKEKFAGMGDHLIYLRCYDQDAPNHHLAIMIRELGGNNFARKNQTLCRLPGPLWQGTRMRTIYIRKAGAIPSYHRTFFQAGKSMAFQIKSTVLGKKINVVKCWPEGQWFAEQNRVVAPTWEDVAVSINNWSWHVVLVLRPVVPSHVESDEEADILPDCVLALGYDGINDRCWSLLRDRIGSLEIQWEECVNTKHQYRTYKFPIPDLDWTLKVDLVDFPEQTNTQLLEVDADWSGQMPASQTSFVVPVNIEISSPQPDESVYDSDLNRRLEELAGKHSFASIVNHSFVIGRHRYIYVNNRAGQLLEK